MYLLHITVGHTNMLFQEDVNLEIGPSLKNNFIEGVRGCAANDNCN
jgi:hypothetical protein